MSIFGFSPSVTVQRRVNEAGRSAIPWGGVFGNCHRIMVSWPDVSARETPVMSAPVEPNVVVDIRAEPTSRQPTAFVSRGGPIRVLYSGATCTTTPRQTVSSGISCGSPGSVFSRYASPAPVLVSAHSPSSLTRVMPIDGGRVTGVT